MSAHTDWPFKKTKTAAPVTFYWECACLSSLLILASNVAWTPMYPMFYCKRVYWLAKNRLRQTVEINDDNDFNDGRLIGQKTWFSLVVKETKRRRQGASNGGG